MAADVAVSGRVDTAEAVRVTSGFGIDHLTRDVVAVPAPGPDEVLVRLKAVSLNYRDLLVINGLYNPDLSRPLVVASDAAGEVVAVGPAVTAFKPGDRVTAAFFQGWPSGRFERRFFDSTLGGGLDGVLATARVFPQQGLVPLPAHLSYEEGAALPCAALTAWHALVPTAHVKSGDNVLLIGTGGVSIFALQFAKMHGARVIILSSSDAKLSRAKSLGADEGINYRNTPEWDREVLALTGGTGADIVVEVGGAGTFARSLAAVRPQGQVSVIGGLSGVIEPLNIVPILQGLVRVQGINVGPIEMFRQMIHAISINRLKPVIDRVFELGQYREALRYLESGQHFGKVVVTLG